MGSQCIPKGGTEVGQFIADGEGGADCVSN